MLDAETLYNLHGKGLTKLFHEEYNSWSAMKDRCTRHKNRIFYKYGGLGIKVCKRWTASFVHFLVDMGEKPHPKKDYSLDRINPYGNYEPGNCRWATRSEQAQNQRKRVDLRRDICALSGDELYKLLHEIKAEM